MIYGFVNDVIIGLLCAAAFTGLAMGCWLVGTAFMAIWRDAK